MASLDKLEGDLIEGLLIVILIVIVFVAISAGGGEKLAASALRKVWYAVDGVFSKGVSLLTSDNLGANILGKITGTDSANTGSTLGGGGSQPGTGGTDQPSDPNPTMPDDSYSEANDPYTPETGD